MPRSKHSIPSTIGCTFQVKPHLRRRVPLVGVALWKWLPGLHVDRSIVQEFGAVRHILHIARMPGGVELSPQAYLSSPFGFHEAPSFALRFLKGPDGCHP